MKVHATINEVFFPTTFPTPPQSHLLIKVMNTEEKNSMYLNDTVGKTLYEKRYISSTNVFDFDLDISVDGNVSK